MIPSPRTFLLLLSRIETVRPTTPSPPAPRSSLRPRNLGLSVESSQNECRIGFDKSRSSSKSESVSFPEPDVVERAWPYLLCRGQHSGFKKDIQSKLTVFLRATDYLCYMNQTNLWHNEMWSSWRLLLSSTVSIVRRMTTLDSDG